MIQEVLRKTIQRRLISQQIGKMATWLDTVFGAFDSSILGALHQLAEVAGAFFTPIFDTISLFGDKLVIAGFVLVVLCLYKRTRKPALIGIVGLALGSLIGTLILKNTIMRLRPYEVNETYRAWWELVNGVEEWDRYSFPSGHSMTAMAIAMGFILTEGRRVIVPSIIGVLLMGVSRLYLMVHFPSDILAGYILGAICGYLGYLIMNKAYAYMEDHQDKPWCKQVLTFDLYQKQHEKKS